MFFSFDIFGWFSFVRIQVYGVEPAESAVLNGGKPGQYNVSYTLFTWFLPWHHHILSCFWISMSACLCVCEREWRLRGANACFSVLIFLVGFLLFTFRFMVQNHLKVPFLMEEALVSYNISYTLFTWFCLGTVAFFHVSG